MFYLKPRKFLTQAVPTLCQLLACMAQGRAARYRSFSLTMSNGKQLAATTDGGCNFDFKSTGGRFATPCAQDYNCKDEA